MVSATTNGVNGDVKQHKSWILTAFVEMCMLE